ncbi:MAG: CRISPR-associated endonuclease Cas2 [Synergistaceae bacterium]|jgi:CRISPR-associated protein Cas2|nr:CRISPR-associated endonuclease Cas2 [Synergistaceae bacterium]
MAKMLRLLSYDIADAKRRGRIAKILEGYARRVQYSIFETYMAEGDLSALVSKTLPFVVPKEGDSLLVYRLCGSCARQRRAWGHTVIDWEEAIVV